MMLVFRRSNYSYFYPSSVSPHCYESDWSFPTCSGSTLRRVLLEYVFEDADCSSLITSAVTDPRALRLGKWKCGSYSALECKEVHQEMISGHLAVAREGMGCLSKLVMKERMSFSP